VALLELCFCSAWIVDQGRSRISSKYPSKGSAPIHTPVFRISGSLICRLSTNPNIPDEPDNDNNEEAKIQNARQLQQALRNLANSNQKKGSQQDASLGYAVPDLEGLISSASEQGQSIPAPRTPFPKTQESLEQDEEAPFSMDMLMDNEEGGGNAETLDASSGTLHAELDDDLGGIFLDGDMYVNSRKYMNPDGSLKLPDKAPQIRAQILENMLFPPDMAPTETDFEQEATLEDIIAALNAAPLDESTRNQRAQTLHEQILAEEQAYLQQSDLFRHSLTNRTAANEAFTLRRSARYREQQEEELKKLDEQMKEIEEIFKSRNSVQICSECQCKLGQNDKESFVSAKNQRVCGPCFQLQITSREETYPEQGVEMNWREDEEMEQDGSEVQETYPEQGAEMNWREDEEMEQDGSEVDGGEWVLVDDPDTGEPFYWNEKTGEMRYEL
jgi:hypothetical protein